MSKENMNNNTNNNMNNAEIINNVMQQLYNISGNEGCKTYNNKLIPGGKPSLGCKIPELRKLAKLLVRDERYGGYKFLLENLQEDYYEQEALKAFVIGYAKDDLESILQCAAGFVPKIHDWAVCDGFCQTFTIARKYREEVFRWVSGYISSEKEYEQRVVAVLLLSHYLVDEYIDEVLLIMDKLKHDGYYTKMGVAWCVATAYAKYPDKTMEYLKHNSLDDWTYNKSIQKMLESFRVPESHKQVLRSMKRQM